LERLAADSPTLPEVNELAAALWKHRHPEFIPVVRHSLEMIPLPAPHGLHGLLTLLEHSPEALAVWAGSPAVPLGHKIRVLVVLEEDVPDSLMLTLPAFIAVAENLREQALGSSSDAAVYCQRLFSLLLLHRERSITSLPEEARSALRSVARSLVTAASMSSALPAAVILKLVGRAEDIALLEKHRPADDPGFAKVFEDAAQSLRKLPASQ
jgi:hypothetical protein